MKDCPKFVCRECCEQGHYARDCTAARCPDCRRALISCECQDEGESAEPVEETPAEIEDTESGLQQSLVMDTGKGNDRVEEHQVGAARKTVSTETKDDDME